MLHTINNRYQYDPQKDLLGRNAYSKVYFAYDSQTDNYVIMKLYVGEWTELYELTGEALKLKYLEHPHLLRYLDVFEMQPIEQQDQLPPAVVVITEFVQGMNLATYLEQKNQATQLKSVYKGILSAIAYLQDNKRVITDIQPHNILLHFSEEGIHAKLDVLNISQLPIRNYSGLNQASETPPMTLQNDWAMACYPPESFNPQMYGVNKLSTSANFWAFGVLLYRCLTKQLPFGQPGAEKSFQELIEDIHTKTLPEEITQINEPYRSIIVQCLVKDPRERIQRSEGLQELLNDASELEEISLPPKEDIEGIALSDNLFLLTGFSLEADDDTTNVDLIETNAHAYPTLEELMEEETTVSTEEETTEDTEIETTEDTEIETTEDTEEEQFPNPPIPQSLNPPIPQSLNPSDPQPLNPSIPQSPNSPQIIYDKKTKKTPTATTVAQKNKNANLLRLGLIAATFFGLLGLFFLVKNCADFSSEGSLKVIKPYIQPSKESLIQNMVLIEGATFERGQKDPSIACEDCNTDEQPVKSITLSSFYIDPYEISNAQFADFLNWYGGELVKEGENEGKRMINPHKWGVHKINDIWVAQEGYERHPVVFVTWYGATEYARFIGKRLPTEAEWEFAARGGDKSRAYKMSGDDDPEKIAWFMNNTENTREIGLLAPNELGLYDMSGNVQEWCADWYNEDAYEKVSTTNPFDTISSRRRCVRGGHWRDDQYLLYSTDRNKFSPGNANNFTGFRCVMDLEEP